MVQVEYRKNLDMNPQRDLLFYRNELEVLNRFGVTWEACTDDILEILPHVCKDAFHIWRVRTLIIYFEIMEMHAPHQVLHQFRFV